MSDTSDKAEVLKELENEKQTLEDRLDQLDKLLAETRAISQAIRESGEEMVKRVELARARVAELNRLLLAEKGSAEITAAMKSAEKEIKAAAKAADEMVEGTK